MKSGFFKTVTLCLIGIVGFWVVGTSAFAASPSAALLKAKKEAEAKGFIFETSHDEIVAKAKKEGMVQVLGSLDPDVYPHMITTFKKKYPFIEVAMLEITGTEAAQRFLLEVKAGGATEFDIVHPSSDSYPEWPPYAKKFDILGMAKHGVLGIPPKMVDPNNRTIIGLGHALSAVAYNKNLISADKVPDKWEDFLKPEFKGRKFLLDIRPHLYAVYASCPDQGMGVEWMVNYAKRMRAQDPTWVRGHTRSLTAMVAGEYALHSGTNYHSANRLLRKFPTGPLRIKLIEPVPVRLMEPEMVLASSAHPYAALLFLEHQASPEGQKNIDKYEPLKGSIFSPGAALNKAVKGKKVCVNGFKTYRNSSKWMRMAIEAFGFPKAERKKR